MIGVVLKRFDNPDEVRVFQKGRLEVVRIGAKVIGRATYEPGWKWSEHVGPTVGATRCTVEHVGLVLAGVATAAFDNGPTVELKEGSLFYIPAIPHDSAGSWVTSRTCPCTSWVQSTTQRQAGERPAGKGEEGERGRASD